MEKFLEIFQWILANYQVILSSLIGVMSAIIAVALLIPGDNPEKTLQKIVDFLKKFSKK